MRYVPTCYIPGQPWGICDRCGFQYRLSELRTEWTGLKVCSEDWDPRPPDMTPPYLYPEGVPIPDSRPDTQPVYLEGGVLLLELPAFGGVVIDTDGSRLLLE